MISNRLALKILRCHRFTQNYGKFSVSRIGFGIFFTFITRISTAHLTRLADKI